jgi:hypothetical protein
LTPNQIKRVIKNIQDSLGDDIRIKYRIYKRRHYSDGSFEFKDPPVINLYLPSNVHYADLLFTITHEIGHIIDFSKRPYDRHDARAEYLHFKKHKMCKRLKDREIRAWLEGWFLLERKLKKDLKEFFKIMMAEALRTYDVDYDVIVEELKKIRC